MIDMCENVENQMCHNRSALPANRSAFSFSTNFSNKCLNGKVNKKLERLADKFRVTLEV